MKCLVVTVAAEAGLFAAYCCQRSLQMWMQHRSQKPKVDTTAADTQATAAGRELESQRRAGGSIKSSMCIPV
jgi:hypothetical protein